MDIDEVYLQIGELGPYQRRLLAAVFMQNLWMAHHMVHMVFIGRAPAHHMCHHGARLPDYYESLDYCHTPPHNITCEKYTYPEPAQFTSIVTEWDLVCEKSSYANILQSGFMAGVLVGAIIFGAMSDNYGRRKALLTSLVGLTVFSFLGSLSWSYAMYMAMRVLAGTFTAGIILVSFVLGTEFVGSSRRALVSMVFPGAFAIGIMTLSMLSYLLHSWRALSVVTALPGLIFIVWTYCLIPESPRWLLIHGRQAEAETILETMASTNKSKLKTICLLEPETQKHTSHGILDLLRHPELYKRTTIQMFAWFVCSCVYYGLTMSSGSLGSSIYISVILSALVEIPAYFLCMPLIAQLGRKWSFAGAMVLGGLSCMLIMVTPPNSMFVTALALTGKLAISAAFAIAYLYSAELYPTVVRNNAMGVCSMAARVGGILAPVLGSLDAWYPASQYAIFGILAFTAGLAATRLPETAGQVMPETIEDLQNNNDDSLVVKVRPLSEDKVKLLEEDILQEEKLLEEMEESRI